MEEGRFRRDLGSLEAIFAMVARFVAAEAIPPSVAFNLDLVAEELFTNMVRHGRSDGSDIAIALARADGAVTVTLRDFDAEPFDPTRAPEVDVTLPPDQRRAGGLGLHLVRTIADTVDYAHEDRTSTITVRMRLEP